MSYGINNKYEGMLAHSFDRFYVVTQFILPTAEDLKFLTLNSDKYFEILITIIIANNMHYISLLVSKILRPKGTQRWAVV